MLKQVVLPAPFGPISASSSPAATAKLTPRDRLDAAERLCEVLDREDRHHSGSLFSNQPRSAPAMPCGNSEHQHEDHDAQHARQ